MGIFEKKIRKIKSKDIRHDLWYKGFRKDLSLITLKHSLVVYAIIF